MLLDLVLFTLPHLARIGAVVRSDTPFEERDRIACEPKM
jgi:hypothetical protein